MRKLIRSGGIMALDRLRQLVHAEDGQALVEYSLIVLLIVLVCVSALRVMGQDVSSMLSPLSSDF